MRQRSDSTADSTLPAWLRRVWNAPWLWMALVVAVFCVPLFVGLGQPDFDNDEAIYSFSVDVMVKSGDWLTPKLIPSETSAFLEKPPLKFWIVGLPIHWGLLPANEFGMRFWDAVMASVAFLYIFAIGRRLAGPLCGFTAVMLLFANGRLILEHGLRTNNMEAAVFLTYAAGMYHFLAWRSSGPDSRGHVFAIALYFVLGFMTKFVAALFLPLVLGMAVWLKADDRFRLRLQWLTFVLAGLTAAALIAPWFIYQYFARGPELFGTMFGAHVVKRFTAYLDPDHLRPWHFYVTTIWHELRTSSTAALIGLGSALVVVRALRRRWLEGALLVLWFAVPVGVISIGTSKLYHYAYPFLPPLALAGGYALAKVVDLAWRWFKRPAEMLVDMRARAWPGFLRSATVRTALTVLGIAALALAVVTGLLERVRLVVRGTRLFRNSSLVRPAVAGSLALLVGAPASAVRAIVPLAVLLGVLPFPGVYSTLAQMRNSRHPLQDTRACLSQVVDRVVAQGRNRTGGLGGSEVVPAQLHLLPVRSRALGTNATCRPMAPWPCTSIAPSAYRPVLLSTQRYADFMGQLAHDAPDVMTRAAAKADLSPDVLVDRFRNTDFGVIPWDSVVLLLARSLQRLRAGTSSNWLPVGCHARDWPARRRCPS